MTPRNASQIRHRCLPRAQDGYEVLQWTATSTRMSPSHDPCNFMLKKRWMEEPLSRWPSFGLGRSSGSASPNGIGKLRIVPLPLVEAVRVHAQQGRVAVEGSALCHEPDDTVSELWSVRCGSSGASAASGWWAISYHARMVSKDCSFKKAPPKTAVSCAFPIS